MAAGKSTLGKALANTLGWEFVDLDILIEQKTNKKVSEIFNTYGEKYFRNLEKNVLEELIKKNKIVIALGGGAYCNDESSSLINKSGLVIYIKTPPEIVFKRLRFKKDRPVLLDENGQIPPGKILYDKIMSLYNERDKYYSKAQITIESGKKSFGKLVDYLVKELKTKY